MKKKHIGSTLDSLFDELGEREEVELLTQKKRLAAKIERAMVRRKITQVELAKAMRTSRTVVHAARDPGRDRARRVRRALAPEPYAHLRVRRPG
jgi:hypothetical protein